MNETNTTERNGRLFVDGHSVPLVHRVSVAAEFKELGETQGAEINLISHVARHKDDFVLNPSIDHGGIGVVVGKEQDDATWERMLAQAEHQQQWVVQEVLEKPTALFPRIRGDKIEWNPFQMVHGALVLGGELCTTLIRAQPASGSRVINVLQGAELAVCAIHKA